MFARSSSDETADVRHSRRRRTLQRTLRDTFDSTLTGVHSRRPSFLVRARRSRKAVAGLTASSLLAAAAITGTAMAASGAAANPYARVSIVKMYDGTGQGDKGQTFINAANGYHPGDNTTTDGVVASGDVVGYDVVIEIAAGPKRTIRVSLDDPEFLTWAADLSTWAAPGTVTKVRLDGDDLVLDVPAGKVETLIRSVVMRADDTAGLAVGGQVVRLNVGVDGGTAPFDPYASAAAPAVTVVSAPMADLTIYPSVNAFEAQVGRHAAGTFIIEPMTLNAPGYSSKGAASAGTWRAWLDVSEFPAGTAFTVGTTPVSVVDGRIRIEAAGTVPVGWALPAGWPEQEPGSTLEYAVHLVVDADSFSTTGENAMANNAIGWQPGDGEGRDFDTRDEATGATRGVSFMNNDWAAVRAHYPRDIATPGEIFGAAKSVETPMTPGVTLFDPGSLAFAEASGTRTLWREDRDVAPSTELWTVLAFSRSGIEVPAEQYVGSLVLADSWDATEQHFDHTRALSVTLSDGRAVDPSLYMVQWHADRNAVEGLAADGWQDGLPGPGAQAVRVVLSREVYDAHAPNSRVTARLPFRVLDEAQFNQSDQGDWIDDTYLAGLLAEDGGVTRLKSEMQGGYLVLPREQQWTITQSVEVTDPQTAQVKPVAQAGDTATYTVVPGVANLLSASGTFTPTVTITLDRCLSNPMLVEPSAWTVVDRTDARPGLSGKVCGDPDAVPATMTLQASDIRVTSVEGLNGTLPKIVFRGTVANLARSASGTAVTVASGITGEKAIGEPIAEASFAVIGDHSTTAGISAPPVVEIDDEFEVVANTYLSAGDGSDHVIVLPRAGDDVLIDELESTEGYEGPAGSSFHGTYTVTGVRVDEDNSSPGTRTLYFTTDEDPTLDVSTSTWYLVDGPDSARLTEATAIRVVTEDQPDHSANTRVVITLDPDGNHEGDRYLTWISSYKDPDPESSVSTLMPWPAVTEVVASSIAGVVWWDRDEDGRMDVDETRQPDVTVTLHDAAGTLVRETTTDADGAYLFDALHSGEYTVMVHRDSHIAFESYKDAYGEDRDVHNTASFYRKLMDQASDKSTTIKLGVDADQVNVNFGYWRTDPHATVDKDVDHVYDRGAAYDIEWSVTVTNDGNTPIPVGDLVDRMDSDVTDVTATLTPPIRPTILHEYNGTYLAFVGSDGVLWSQSDTSSPIRLADAGTLVYTSGNYVVFTDADGVLWSQLGTSSKVRLGDGGEIVYSYGSYVVFTDVDGVLWSQSGVSKPVRLADGAAIQAKFMYYVVYTDTEGVLWSQNEEASPVHLGAGATVVYRYNFTTVYSDAGGVLWSQVGRAAPVRLADQGTLAYSNGDYIVVADPDGRLWALATANRTSPVELSGPGGRLLHTSGAYVWFTDSEGALWRQNSLSDRVRLAAPGAGIVWTSGTTVYYKDVDEALWYQDGTSTAVKLADSGDITYSSGTFVVFTDSDGALWSRSAASAPVRLAGPGATILYSSGAYVVFTDMDGVMWSQYSTSPVTRLADPGARVAYTSGTQVWIADADNLIWNQSQASAVKKLTPDDTIVQQYSVRTWVSATGELWATYYDNPPNRLAAPGWTILAASDQTYFLDSEGALWHSIYAGSPVRLAPPGVTVIRMGSGTVVYADADGAVWSAGRNGVPFLLDDVGIEIVSSHGELIIYVDHDGTLWRQSIGFAPVELSKAGHQIHRFYTSSVWFTAPDGSLWVDSTRVADPGTTIVDAYENTILLQYPDGSLWRREGANDPIPLLGAGWSLVRSNNDGRYVLSDAEGSLWYSMRGASPVRIAGPGWEVVYRYSGYFVFTDNGALYSVDGSSRVKLADAGWNVIFEVENRLWYTDDRGALWHQWGSAPPSRLSDEGWKLLNAHGSNGGYVWYTDNDGALWRQRGTEAPGKVEVADGIEYAHSAFLESGVRVSPVVWFVDLDGELWRQNYTGDPVSVAKNVTVVGAAGSTIWYLDAFGALWKQTGTSAPSKLATRWPPRTDHRILLDPTKVTPGDDGFTSRVYPITDLQPGESRTVWFRGTVLRPSAGDHLITNQAWFDSPMTPFEKTPQVFADIVDPDVERIDEFNRESDPENPDDPSWQEDHVVVVVPAMPGSQVFGSIGGVVWRDGTDVIEPDGKRDASDILAVGATVELILESTGTVVATTATDEDGAYLFSGLPIGASYTVRFTLPDPAGAWITRNDTWSDVYPATSLSQLIPLTTTAKDVMGIDAGYRLWSPEILGVYGVPGQDGDTLVCQAPEYDQTPALEVPVELRNTGKEPLNDLRVVFTGTHPVTSLIVDGYEVAESGDGSYSLSGPNLPVNGVLTGRITVLPNTCEAGVDNDMTVHGRGVDSSLAVQSNDPYTADSRMPKADLIVRHIIQDTEEDLAEPAESSGLPGAPYQTDELTGDALVKDGLTYALVEQPENADGSYGADGSLTEVVYVYKRVTAIPEDGNIDLPLPPTGGQRDLMGVIAGALVLALLIGMAAYRGVRLSPLGTGDGGPRHARPTPLPSTRGRHSGG